jgi:ABC-type uncharacterized transport system YnjBCD ATPase subunit
MIKLLNILQEIVVTPNSVLHAVYQKILDYIQNGSQGDLDLREVGIKRLPKSLKVVGGHLFLTDTSIESLPDNLTVTGNLFLNGTPIQSLPDNLTVGGHLYLTDTSIESLPDNLTVEGGLYLSNTPIQSLPDNLTVGGNLFLSYTPLSEKYTTKEQLKTEYPNIEVKGNIFL